MAFEIGDLITINDNRYFLDVIKDDGSLLFKPVQEHKTDWNWQDLVGKNIKDMSGIQHKVLKVNDDNRDEIWLTLDSGGYANTYSRFTDKEDFNKRFVIAKIIRGKEMKKEQYNIPERLKVQKTASISKGLEKIMNFGKHLKVHFDEKFRTAKIEISDEVVKKAVSNLKAFDENIKLANSSESKNTANGSIAYNGYNITYTWADIEDVWKNIGKVASVKAPEGKIEIVNDKFEVVACVAGNYEDFEIVCDKLTPNEEVMKCLGFSKKDGKYIKIASGDLVIKDHDDIAKDCETFRDALDMLGYIGNGYDFFEDADNLFIASNEEFSLGLTNIPVIIEGGYYADDGKYVVPDDAEVYVFEGYETLDELKILQENGEVAFTRLEDKEEKKAIDYKKTNKKANYDIGWLKDDIKQEFGITEISKEQLQTISDQLNKALNVQNEKGWTAGLSEQDWLVIVKEQLNNMGLLKKADEYDNGDNIVTNGSNKKAYKNINISSSEYRVVIECNNDEEAQQMKNAVEKSKIFVDSLVSNKTLTIWITDSDGIEEALEYTKRKLTQMGFNIEASKIKVLDKTAEIVQQTTNVFFDNVQEMLEYNQKMNKENPTDEQAENGSLPNTEVENTNTEPNGEESNEQPQENKTELSESDIEITPSSKKETGTSKEADSEDNKKPQETVDKYDLKGLIVDLKTFPIFDRMTETEALNTLNEQYAVAINIENGNSAMVKSNLLKNPFYYADELKKAKEQEAQNPPVETQAQSEDTVIKQRTVAYNFKGTHKTAKLFRKALKENDVKMYGFSKKADVVLNGITEYTAYLDIRDLCSLVIDEQMITSSSNLDEIKEKVVNGLKDIVDDIKAVSIEFNDSDVKDIELNTKDNKVTVEDADEDVIDCIGDFIYKKRDVLGIGDKATVDMDAKELADIYFANKKTSSKKVAGYSTNDIDVTEAKNKARDGKVVSATIAKYFKDKSWFKDVVSAEIKDNDATIFFNLKNGDFVEVEVKKTTEADKFIGENLGAEPAMSDDPDIKKEQPFVDDNGMTFEKYQSTGKKDVAKTAKTDPAYKSMEQNLKKEKVKGKCPNCGKSTLIKKKDGIRTLREWVECTNCTLAFETDKPKKDDGYLVEHGIWEDTDKERALMRSANKKIAYMKAMPKIWNKYKDIEDKPQVKIIDKNNGEKHLVIDGTPEILAYFEGDNANDAEIIEWANSNGFKIVNQSNAITKERLLELAKKADYTIDDKVIISPMGKADQEYHGQCGKVVKIYPDGVSVDIGNKVLKLDKNDIYPMPKEANTRAVRQSINKLAKKGDYVAEVYNYDPKKNIDDHKADMKIFKTVEEAKAWVEKTLKEKKEWLDGSVSIITGKGVERNYVDGLADAVRDKDGNVVWGTPYNYEEPLEQKKEAVKKKSKEQISDKEKTDKEDKKNIGKKASSEIEKTLKGKVFDSADSYNHKKEFDNIISKVIQDWTDYATEQYEGEWKYDEETNIKTPKNKGEYEDFIEDYMEEHLEDMLDDVNILISDLLKGNDKKQKIKEKHEELDKYIKLQEEKNPNFDADKDARAMQLKREIDALENNKESYISWETLVDNDHKDFKSRIPRNRDWSTLNEEGIIPSEMQS